MNVSFLDKNKNILDNVRNIFRDVDANELKNAVNSKQDAEIGKGLSQNDYTNTDKSKVNSLPPNVVQDITDEANARIAGDSTTLVSAKTYADGLVVGLWDDRGAFDASASTYPASGGSGTSGAIKKGDIWTISVAGTLPTLQVVEVGDTVRALIDAPGNTQANWSILQNNIGYVAENATNKATTMSGNTTSNIVYLTAKAIYDWAIGLFIQKNIAITGATKTKVTYDSNGLVTDGSDATTADIADSTDKRYQTDAQRTANDATSSIQTQLNNKQATLVSGTNIKTINGNDMLGGGNLTIVGVTAKQQTLLDELELRIYN